MVAVDAEEAVATGPAERFDGDAVPPPVTRLGAVVFDGDEPCSIHAASLQLLIKMRSVRTISSRTS
jgi:hypothetical protein